PGATPPPAAAQAAVVAPPPPTVQGQPAAAAKPGAAPAQAAKPPAPGAPKPAGPPVAAAPARPPSAAQPAAAKPAAAPAPAAAPKDPAVELEELRKLVAKLEDQNLFEILGLKESADSAAVKVAYFKLAKLHHPDTVPQNAPPELAKLKEDFFAAVGEAYRRLGDDKSRAEYIEELKTGSGEEVDVQAILMAEELFTKGRIMVQAKKFADAVKMLDDAIKANGEEGEFYAWRGFAKFFSNPDRKEGFNEAMKDLQLCLKKNPRVAQAYYFQGVMAKLLGDNANAQKLFAKTVELQPNHVDAQRELRMNKK
ncbi:MAG: DnaJ domain-containing protein, partial [Myxococcaceae bacterium]